MTSELDVYFFVGLALVPALIAFGVIWWRQSKQPLPLGVAKLGVVGLVTYIVCLAALVLFMFVANLSGFQSPDSIIQPFGIASGVVGYFIGNMFALRLAKAAAK